MCNTPPEEGHTYPPSTSPHGEVIARFAVGIEAVDDGIGTVCVADTGRGFVVFINGGLLPDASECREFPASRVSCCAEAYEFALFVAKELAAEQLEIGYYTTEPQTMNTPATPANVAIVALVRSIASDSAGLAALAIEAEEAAEAGNLNLTIGTLLPAQLRVDLLKTQLDAVTALHRATCAV